MAAVLRTCVPVRRARAVALLLALLLAGCSAAYWTDRGRDFLDVPTISLELVGYPGASAQAGPFATGFFIFPIGESKSPVGAAAGLVGGEFTVAETSDFALLLGYAFEMHLDNDERGKGYSYKGLSFWPVLMPMEEPFGLLFEKDPPWIPPDPRRMAPRYTAVEAMARVLVGARVGLNPGELLDFLAGFAGIDFYGDDVSGKRGEAPPAPSEKIVLRVTVTGFYPSWNKQSPEGMKTFPPAGEIEQRARETLKVFNVTTTVDEAMEGSYFRKRFEFQTAEPEKNGLEANRKYLIQARWAGNRYEVESWTPLERGLPPGLGNPEDPAKRVPPDVRREMEKAYR